ncbi:MAG: DUF309 domain-containing protein [Candidatus Nitrosotenuis sp.]
MLHLKNTGFAPQDTGELLERARMLGKGCIIRDCRVSTKYVEFDVSISKSRLDILLEKLTVIAPLDHARLVEEENIDKDEGVQKGISYFNDERFWEAHEVLEGVWKKSYEGEKELVQGIILIAAALVHFQKAENLICLSILKRAEEKLSRSGGMYHDIDVDQMRKKLHQIIDSEKIFLFTI